jgi:3-dehydro-4-phosphotetronate decarboxylase
MNDNELRAKIVMHGKSLFDRGYVCGSSGNLSVRLSDGILITPTNSCLGRLDPERISKIHWDGSLLAGEKPSKEAPLHLAMYRARPKNNAVVHLHSTYCVALSCMSGTNSRDVLPPITAYFVMRIGKLPTVPYYPPGDSELANAVEAIAPTSNAVLLANHGPVVAGGDLDAAVYAMEELEETARLYFLLKNENVRFLSEVDCNRLREQFPN